MPPGVHGLGTLLADAFSFLHAPTLVLLQKVSPSIGQFARLSLQQLRNLSACDQVNSEQLLLFSRWPVPEASSEQYRSYAAEIPLTSHWASAVVCLLRHMVNLRAFELCILFHDPMLSQEDIDHVLHTLARCCPKVCSLCLQVPDDIFKAQQISEIMPRLTSLSLSPVPAFALGCILGALEALGRLPHLESLEVGMSSYSVEDYDHLASFLTKCSGLRCFCQLDVNETDLEGRAWPLMQMSPPNGLAMQRTRHGGLLWTEPGGCRVEFCPSLHGED